MKSVACAVLLMGACFNPTFRDPTCGPNGECPPSTTCVDGVCRASAGGGDDAASVDSGADAYVPDAGNCTAQVDECLAGTDVLRRCDAPGATSYDVVCSWGCKATPDPHCAQIVPAGGGATAADLAVSSALTDVTLSGALTVNSDTGSIGTIRAAGTGIVNGIDYQQRGAIAVFRFKSVEVLGGANIRMSGTRAIAFVADSAITIDGILDLRGNGELPGPGGSAGGISAGQAGSGPGAGDSNSLTAGSGAGHGALGGAGDGGLPSSRGATYGTAQVAMLVGGSGGGAGGGTSFGKGGGGGGALQLVSNTSITISSGGGINAGGGGAGATTQRGGGGGSGGTLLLEAPRIAVNGMLAVNGGGGAGKNTGPAEAGHLDRIPALGDQAGPGGVGPTPAGGDSMDPYGGGGGAVGRIRFNTRGGTQLTVTGVLSPSFTDPATTCTQGSAVLQ